MTHVLKEPAAARLASGGAADAQPELSEGVLRLLSAYARSLLPEAASADAERASAAVGTTLRIAAACTCSHHRGVAAAAIGVTSDVLGAAVNAEVRDAPRTDQCNTGVYFTVLSSLKKVSYIPVQIPSLSVERG